MNFDFYFPTKIISGKDCILGNSALFKLGKACLIVTGASSAKRSGALDDVTCVLEKLGIEYSIYDKITENPLISVCRLGGAQANSINADFIIGIGGGSPMDAAKAIAVYAANPDIPEMEVYNVAALKAPLPVVAVPTTAGTGSEVNPYAVMTLDGQSKKKSISDVSLYPKYAFLDAKYSMSLNRYYTVSTALDAFCHSVESYMSPKATEVSTMFALYGARGVYKVFKSADTGALTYDERQKLLFASCAAGIAISTTGTGFPHPLGYNLTFDFNIPHGNACAVFIGEYLAVCGRTAEGKERLDKLTGALCTTAEELCRFIPELSGVELTLDETRAKIFIDRIKDAKNLANCVSPISVDEAMSVYLKLFSKR